MLVRKKNERSLILVSVSLTKIEIREEKKKIWIFLKNEKKLNHLKEDVWRNNVERVLKKEYLYKFQKTYDMKE